MPQLFCTWSVRRLPRFSESNHREQAAQSLLSGIRNARTEAITRNQTVVIHAIDGDWSQGWRIILDISGKGPQDSSNPLLVEPERVTGGYRLSAIGRSSRYVRFSSLGNH